MNALLWIGVAFLAPGAVALGILFSIPVVLVTGVVGICAELAPMVKRYFRNRFHPLRRKTPPPMYWL